MEPLTEEQQKDINERVEGFRTGYLELVKQFEVDFVSYPQYQQQADGTYSTIPTLTVVDKKYLPQQGIKSPFVEQP